MRLALGIVFMWWGGMLFYVASHGTAAHTPFQFYQEIIGKIQNA